MFRKPTSISSRATISMNISSVTPARPVFGRLTWAPVPAFRLTVGGRYSSEQKTLDGTLQGAIRTCVVPSSYFPTYTPGCPTAQPFPVDFTAPIPDFNPAPGRHAHDSQLRQQCRCQRQALQRRNASPIGWAPIGMSVLTACFTQAMKPASNRAVSSSRPIAASMIPRRSVPGRSGRRTGSSTIACSSIMELFYWRYSNQQITHLVGDSPGQCRVRDRKCRSRDVQGCRGRGALSADAQHRTQCRRAISRRALQGRFTYRRRTRMAGIDNGTSCANVGTPGTSYTVDCSGKRPAYAPVWTINLGARQTIPLANNGKIVANARAHYQSETLTGLEFSAPEYQSSYWLADAELSYVAPVIVSPLPPMSTMRSTRPCWRTVSRCRSASSRPRRSARRGPMACAAVSNSDPLP